MTPLMLGLCLVAMMIAAKFWSDDVPLNQDCPLDVDRDLPWPEVAQASSVFSLTALFGTFLSVAVLVGLPALLGAAVGSISALVATRNAVLNSRAVSFETFVLERLTDKNGTPSGVLHLLVLIQLGFAISEVTILREVAISGLGMVPRHALILVLSVALVAYYYCLVGGYRTLFRADLVQFIAIALMCGALAVVGVHRVASAGSIVIHAHTAANPEVWNPGVRDLRPPLEAILLTGIHAVLGFLSGAVFVIASPDTWKRVFVAVRMHTSRAAFWRLVVVGAIPFVCLLPMVVLAPPSNATTFVPIFFFFTEQRIGVGNTVVVLGIVGTFLSSFAGALLSATHLVVLGRREHPTAFREIRTFQIALAASFLASAFLGIALAAIPNPFAVAYTLVGLYAVAGGILQGTGMMPNTMSLGRTNRIILLLLVAWAIYLARDPETLHTWSIREADSVLFAVVLVAGAVISARRFGVRGAK